MTYHKIYTNYPGHFMFWCPGCDEIHAVNDRWEYNNDPINPTFSPSISVRSGNEYGPTLCHSFVKDGHIQFLEDCTHALHGQTMPLPPFTHPDPHVSEDPE